MKATSTTPAPFLSLAAFVVADIRLIQRNQRSVRFPVRFLIFQFVCRGLENPSESILAIEAPSSFLFFISSTIYVEFMKLYFSLALSREPFSPLYLANLSTRTVNAGASIVRVAKSVKGTGIGYALLEGLLHYCLKGATMKRHSKASTH